VTLRGDVVRALLLTPFLALFTAHGCALKPAARASADPGASASSKKAATEREKPKKGSTSPAPSVGQVIEGKASYYADSLAGRSTASGEPYDPKKLTAAHLTLKFGTRIKVTRVDTGASVVVTVNDRGPYGGRGRILDLSRKAAETLDMIRAGVVSVRAEILGP
jgi:rare lipoprotein A (peptidoglycan hydrolase)